MPKEMIQQHVPIRAPRKWTDEEKQFVIQLDRLMDDVYRHFGYLERLTLSTNGVDGLSRALTQGFTWGMIAHK